MLLQLKNLLTPDEVAQATQLLGVDAPWLDGKVSAGSQARSRKSNQQLAQDSAAVLEEDSVNDVEEIILLAQGMPALPPEGLSLKERMAQIERSIIEQALQRNSGNVSRTAKLLNLQRTTLIEKINKYELRSA